ncbi:TRAP transporter small permease [Poseidonocella sedimentorum]|uniref:TRAP transporter small permease protein n=1 Tax=Poseidonocella sedimentorum TaxID=871652 RepID=A0A1I6DTF8_9RHOB|nr:TRAP transporter small permease [Poseidonocella sedimentorum]SFR08790.1 TRAP-type C4-dicarboxylate transport system, small permease component [Poseidonocella sedimentorum]
MTNAITDARARERFPGRLLRGFADLGGLALLLLMGLVTVSVIFRYVLNQPILGSQELVQIGMAVVVMLGMPYTAHTGQHIRVDILDRAIGRAGRFLGDLFTRVVSIFVLWLVVRKTWDKARDAVEYGDVTNMIEIPLWIAYGAIVLGLGLSILVLALELVRQVLGGFKSYE